MDIPNFEDISKPTDKEIAAEFERRLSLIDQEVVDRVDNSRVFVRTLVHERERVDWLKPMCSEPELVAVPVESPLWYLGPGKSHLDEMMETPEGREQLLGTARDVIEWTAKVIQDHNERIAAK